MDDFIGNPYLIVRRGPSLYNPPCTELVFHASLNPLPDVIERSCRQYMNISCKNNHLDMSTKTGEHLKMLNIEKESRRDLVISDRTVGSHESGSSMDVKAALIRGFTSYPKYIPLWYRYDKQGSIYNDLCLKENKHYYFHRAEIEVLAEYIDDIITEAPNNCALVDFGSGSSEKTRTFIDSLLKKQGKLTYVPVDISADFIKEICQTLSTDYGNSLTIVPVYGDYDTGIKTLREIQSSKLIIWFGSIQNLGYEEQVQKLRLLSNNMTEKDRLLVSTDITTDPQLIYNAYFDPEGHSAKLYYNSLWRLNREYGSNFDEGRFHLIGTFHKSTDPDSLSKFKVRVKSIGDQTIDMPGLGLTLTLKDGEFLNLYEGEGTSCKYTVEQIETLIRKGNFRVRKQWFCRNKNVVFTLV